jgi:predicted porin
VTVYGTLDVNFQTTRAYGTPAPVRSRFAVSTDSSNIGVRGGYDASEYIGAVYQCETSANVDGINASGICNRNSRVGLTGTWGTLFFGNWDTPFKAAIYGTKADDPFNKTDVFGYQSLLGSPGFNYRSGGWSTASNTAISGFDVRGNNSVAFHSASWFGLSSKLQYGANEFKNATGSQNPELYSAALNFDYGPFSLAAAVELHEDAYGLSAINTAVGTFGSGSTNGVVFSEKDTAWRVAAGYQLDSPVGATTLSGMFEQLDYKQERAAATAVKEYKRNAWSVALKHRLGDEELRARFSQADKGSVTLGGPGGNTDGYGASELIVGYSHYFAKSLQGYVSYAKINNARNAQYTFTIGGSSAVAGVTAKGADPQALGLGVRYGF